MKTQQETTEKQIVEVHYYNVVIYVEIKSGEDDYLIQYLKEMVTAREKVTLRQILHWCRNHHLNTRTEFQFRWDFPIQANFMNLLTYCRVKLEMNWKSE